jgi:hypothetical protein
MLHERLARTELPSAGSSGQHVLRFRSQSVAHMVIAVAIAAFMVLAAATAGGRGAPLVDPLSGAVAVAGEWICIRGALAAVVTDATGVTIRNIARTRRYAWREIRAFVLPTFGPAMVLLEGGGYAKVYAIQQSRPTTGTQRVASSQGLIDELNRRLVHARSTSDESHTPPG